MRQSGPSMDRITLILIKWYFFMSIEPRSREEEPGGGLGEAFGSVGEFSDSAPKIGRKTHTPMLDHPRRPRFLGLIRVF